MLIESDESLVECKICNQFFVTLKPHVARKHGITLGEYSKKFPGAPVVTKAHAKEVGDRISESLSGKAKGELHRLHLSESIKKWQSENPEITSQAGEKISKTASCRSLTPEWRENISKGVRKARAEDPTLNEAMATVQRALWADPIHRAARIKAMSEAAKALWSNPEFVEKATKARHEKPNESERALLSLLEEEYPGQWVYNGDGSQIRTLWTWGYVGRLKPDFLRVVGPKQVIFLNGYYWHPTVDEEAQKADFKDSGIECLVVWIECADFVSPQRDHIKALIEGKVPNDD